MYSEIQKLEFKKILNQIKDFAVTDLAKPAVLALEPIDNELEIKRLLAETEQAKIIIQRYDETPMTGVLNIKEAIKKAEIGSVLSIEELIRVVSHQEAISRNLNFIKKVHQLEIPSNFIDDYYERLVSLPKLKQAIENVIDPKGEIYDNASSKLSSIRKKIGITEERIDSKMASLLQSESNKLTDSLITIRNNRLVLPVKAEHKNSFNGVFHDSSSSGETVFMEPMSCFILNNELQGLFIQEAKEIERILSELTETVGLEAIPLRENLSILTYLDILFAKAKYAISLNCNLPEITKSTISLLNARHPLISQKEVVGNNISFRDYRHIIITGPNTGGKTVALKTLGLLSLMVQAGILIPVDEKSKTIIFSGIYADIGDEQSIEQSLSTFSSHISKIIHIIEKAGEKSLVLLDEIGSGTDPKEGASLAISIINHLRNKNLYAMITTHYPELKTYAFDLDDTINASVEFDIETLRPTFKLKIGVPGTSNALQIARRLGLKEEIIKAAEAVSISFDTDISHLIKKLEKQSLELDQETENYHKQMANLKNKENQIDNLYREEKIKQNKLLEELEKEKRNEMKELEEHANKVISELDELKKSAEFKEHELARLKHDAKSINVENTQYLKTQNHEISIGDRVLLIPYQRQGVVNKKLADDKYEILMGSLSVTLNEDDIEFVGKPKVEKPKSSGTVTKTSAVKVELDMRGMRYQEAIDEIDKFVDTCLINNLEFAYIIHGYGTGALKKAVSEYIGGSQAIKSSRPGGQNEGGKGVTVIYFK